MCRIGLSSHTVVFFSSGKFSTMLNYTAAVNETETFISGGPFTVFAPTNEAFSEVEKEKKKEGKSPPTLQQLKQVQQKFSLFVIYRGLFLLSRFSNLFVSKVKSRM